MTAALWLVGAYLIGALPTSYLAGRLAGLDLRQHGSKNLGATNVYRVLGIRYAVPVGLVDVAKGLFPTLLAPTDPPWLPVAVASSTVVGHVFPVYLRFRGGKGVATAAGAVVALAPLALVVSLAVWALVVGSSGYVSLGSIAAAVAFPVAVGFIQPNDGYTLTAGVLLAGFIVYTHRLNVRRLLSGTEHRFRRRQTVRERP